MATSYPDRTNARGIWRLSDITRNIKTEGTFPRGGPSGQTGLLGGGADDSANNTSIEKITHKTFTFKHEILLGQTIAVSGYEVRIWASKDNSGKLITSNIPDEILEVIKA